MYGYSLFRRFLAICLLLGLGWGGSALAQQPIRIGYSVAKTGGLASAAAVQINAFELWRDQVNAKGGIAVGGVKRPVELVVYDDQSQGPKAAQIYEKLITEDKVDFVLTPYATPIHIAIAPVLEKYRMPVIASTYGSTQLRSANVQQMFFMQQLPDTWGKSLAAFLKERGVKRVAIATLQNPFTQELRKNLIADAGGAFQVVVDKSYPADIKDMTPIVSDMKLAAPDAAIVLSYPSDSQMFVSASREARFTAPLQMLMIGTAQPSFMARFGPAAEGYIGLGIWSRNSKNPRAKPFFDAHRAKFGVAPDDKDTTVAYASAEVLEQAIATGGLDKDKVRQALATQTFDTILGPVKFGAGNLNTLAPAGFIQIQNGMNEMVYPAEFATATFKPKT
jgi:branched-chain amino acid transport system substrate-binding protein